MVSSTFRTQRKAPGFSLIEVAIVLALVSLVMFLGSTNATFFDRLLIRSELDKLYAVCRHLQQSAISKGTQEVLTFDLVRKSYHYQDREEKLPSSVNFGVIQGSLGPPSSPSKPITKPLTFAHNKIVFFPDGIIRPGSIYLIDRSKYHMYALSSPISQVSYLRKYKYTNRTWKLI